MARKRRMQGFLMRGGVWHIRTDPVTGKQLSTGYHDEEAALRWRAERERIAADPAHAAATNATVGEWVKRFVASKTAARASEATVEFWTTKVGHLLRILGEDRKLSTINPGLIDWYVDERLFRAARDAEIELVLVP